VSDPQHSPASKPLSSRVEPWVVIVTAVVGTLLAAAAYLFPRSDDSTPAAAGSAAAGSGTASTGAAEPAGATAPSNPQATATAAGGRRLNTIGPVAGQSRLVALPKAVQGQGFTDALVIECPGNQSGDTASEVEYDLNRGYETLSATVTMYYPQAGPDARSELTVFQDSIDRDPGAPASGPQTAIRLGPDETKPLQAAVDQAFFLRIRLRCERPGGFAILNAPTLTRG
jgi:hypothetical protein